MKKMILALATSALALTAQAKTVKSSEVKLDLASIDQVIRLANKDVSGSSLKKLNLVVTDTGMSTDVSPRGGIYLSLASWAEMGNISAEFELTKSMFKFISSKRKSTGIYEIKFIDSSSLKKTTMTVDVRQLLADEKKMRASCGGDFCDKSLASQIIVTEAASDM